MITPGQSALSRRVVIGGSIAAAAVATTGARGAPTALQGDADPVIELRQYKMVRGKRDEFISLFEREFVDSQEKLGIRLVGQFQDMDDPDRYTWIREFPTMAGRAATLNEFYTGPVWHAHRNEANPMLDDNDNVLLLKPSAQGAGFGPVPRRPRPAGDAGTLFATIHYLWKAPADGFTQFFEKSGRGDLERAGARVLGSYVGEARVNDFPRLPVRQGEKVFVWFTRVKDTPRYERALAALRGTKGVMRGSQMLMPDLEERPAQVLRLRSTPRSRF